MAEIVEGGMYGVLKVIIDMIIKESPEFSTTDLIKATGLSRKSCSNNLTRLLKTGLVVREEGKDLNTGVRWVRYRLNAGALEFARDVLFKNEEVIL